MDIKKAVPNPVMAEDLREHGALLHRGKEV